MGEYKTNQMKYVSLCAVFIKTLFLPQIKTQQTFYQLTFKVSNRQSQTIIGIHSRIVHILNIHHLVVNELMFCTSRKRSFYTPPFISVSYCYHHIEYQQSGFIVTTFLIFSLNQPTRPGPLTRLIIYIFNIVLKSVESGVSTSACTA